MKKNRNDTNWTETTFDDCKWKTEFQTLIWWQYFWSIKTPQSTGKKLKFIIQWLSGNKICICAVFFSVYLKNFSLKSISHIHNQLDTLSWHSRGGDYTEICAKPWWWMLHMWPLFHTCYVVSTSSPPVQSCCSLTVGQVKAKELIII